jgi:hypothetical protein
VDGGVDLGSLRRDGNARGGWNAFIVRSLGERRDQLQLEGIGAGSGTDLVGGDVDRGRLLDDIQCGNDQVDAQVLGCRLLRWTQPV